MAAYGKHDGSFFTQRAGFLVAIVILHIGLVWLFASGLVAKVVHTLDPPIQTDIVQETKKPDDAPPPPPPKLDRPPVEVPQIDVVINVPAAPAAATTAIDTRPAPPRPAPPPPPPPKPPEVRVAAKQDAKRSPPTDDYYPPTSRRMNETGKAIVAICWGTDGKVNNEPKIATTSGSSRLDEAAVRYGKVVRMVPGTVNGQPEAGCGNLPVTFKLTD